MSYISSDLWAAFGVFAKAYPTDAGNRMASELAQWTLEQKPDGPTERMEPRESVAWLLS
jgi:hypothetical protein